MSPIFDLTDDLQIALRRMDDGRMVMSVWDDRLEERRCTLDWKYAQALADLIRDYEDRFCPMEGDKSGKVKATPDTMVVDDKEVTADEVRNLREVARDYNMLVDIIHRLNKDWQDGRPVCGDPYMDIVDRFCRTK